MRSTLDDERLLDLQKSQFGGQTFARRAVADGLRASHDLPFSFSDIVLTPGAMSALNVELLAAGRSGGEVILPVPCWLDYPLYIRATGLRPVPVPLAPGTFELDIAVILTAMSERICAVLLSHPLTRPGRNYGPVELAALADAIGLVEERPGVLLDLADRLRGHAGARAPRAEEVALLEAALHRTAHARHLDQFGVDRIT